MRGAPQRKDVYIPVRDLCHPILNHAAHTRILHGEKVARRATHNRLSQRHGVLHEIMDTQQASQHSRSMGIAEKNLTIHERRQACGGIYNPAHNHERHCWAHSAAPPPKDLIAPIRPA
ncbi:hypothetical protein TcCL_ESM05377 [Trypanosoma cruzi]|nr:hypothetical protein TcCL_ESM05377 [Trypanosoma cruzi]